MSLYLILFHLDILEYLVVGARALEDVLLLPYFRNFEIKNTSLTLILYLPGTGYTY